MLQNVDDAPCKRITVPSTLVDIIISYYYKLHLGAHESGKKVALKIVAQHL